MKKETIEGEISVETCYEGSFVDLIQKNGDQMSIVGVLYGMFKLKGVESHTRNQGRQGVYVRITIEEIEKP